jgi:hypothetical protein
MVLSGGITRFSCRKSRSIHITRSGKTVAGYLFRQIRLRRCHRREPGTIGRHGIRSSWRSHRRPGRDVLGNTISGRIAIVSGPSDRSSLARLGIIISHRGRRNGIGPNRLGRRAPRLRSPRLCRRSNRLRSRPQRVCPSPDVSTGRNSIGRSHLGRRRW